MGQDRVPGALGEGGASSLKIINKNNEGPETDKIDSNMTMIW